MNQKVKEAMLIASAYKDSKLVSLIQELGEEIDKVNDNIATKSINLSDGFYKVGYDLPEGEYKLISNDTYSKFMIYQDSRFTKKSIIADEYFDGQIYVTLLEG